MNILNVENSETEWIAELFIFKFCKLWENSGEDLHSYKLHGVITYPRLDSYLYLLWIHLQLLTYLYCIIVRPNFRFQNKIRISIYFKFRQQTCRKRPIPKLCSWVLVLSSVVIGLMESAEAPTSLTHCLFVSVLTFVAWCLLRDFNFEVILHYLQSGTFNLIIDLIVFWWTINFSSIVIIFHTIYLSSIFVFGQINLVAK